RFPAVADKTFLVTIADRSVGGLVARDPMVGRWQVPVADCGVTTTDYDGYTGEAIAIGERPAVALLDPAASARIAIAEAVLNVLAADVAEPSDIKLSANWMAAAGDPQEDAALFDAVRAASRFCQALGLAIPVGKDSLSMRTVWDDEGQRKEQTAPVTLVVSAFARVQDVRRTLTPELAPEGELWFVELSARPHALGASALVQSFGRVGDTPPDASADLLARWMRAWRQIREHATAYHDRSDGGLLVTLAEMGFASRIGIEIAVPDGEDALGFLFSEGPGVVWQAPRSARESIQQALAEHGLDARARVLGQTKPHRKLVIRQGSRTLLDEDLLALRRVWGETSARMQALRDHPRCAEEALDAACDPEDPGLFARLSFDEAENVAAPYIGGAKPKVAILREQGVNGHAEMAAAFARAGFEAVDVHMTDLIEGRASLDGFSGLAACGGFSYGDVLGAGRGWAATIQYHERLREQFARFFARPDTFALGVCNGCQMLAALNAMIPGAEHWPRFTRNESEQFEARLVLVEIVDSPSIFFAGMEGSILPVIVAHGEGRAVFPDAPEKAQPCLRYVGPGAQPAHRYPYNPNGSPGGWTGFTTPDGRITIMMPHPERLFRRVQFSWRPKAWRRSPWLRMFENARRWVAES
ncbi:MAG: phosphoribosylformylglycinamidine synthase, partial [Zetaproteobacteria bacterium]